MKWIEADFKGRKVWAAVHDAGNLVVEGGRIPIRYSDKPGAKVYRAGESNIVRKNGEAVDLDDGVKAEAGKSKKAGKSKGSGFGSAGTRTAAQADAARASAKRLIESFAPSAAVCFTDGACKGNPGPAGAGAVVKLPDGTVHEASLALGLGTNNVGELSAIGLAVDLLDKAGFPPTDRAEICTDSKYTFGMLELGWKVKSNIELVMGLRAKLEGRNVRLHWVAGHVGLVENERADTLANAGVTASIAEGA
jgi:ribonuclease HI